MAAITLVPKYFRQATYFRQEPLNLSEAHTASALWPICIAIVWKYGISLLWHSVNYLRVLLINYHIFLDC